MTSSGSLRRAGRAACLAILAIVSITLAAPFSARCESVLDGKRSSARIRSLGSYFAGIIPDMLTDIRLNPARAWYVDSLTVSYTYGTSGIYGLPFPDAERDLELDYLSIGGYNTNEIRLIGLRALGLRWEIDTEFRFYHNDRCFPTGNWPVDRDSRGDIDVEYWEDCDLNDDNIVRADIAAAREISGAVLGLRIGGAYIYDNRKSHSGFERNYYDYDDQAGDYYLRENQLRENLSDDEKKHYAFYLESGLAWDDSGELVLRAGYGDGKSLRRIYNLEITKRYDEFAETVDEYFYTLSEFRDDREGDAWSVGAQVRKRFSGGLVLFASGSWESGTYTSFWLDGYSRYAWGGYDDIQIEDVLRLPGEGTRTMATALLKIGKTWPLGTKIDITPGARLYWSRTGFEESGDFAVSSYMDYSGTVTALNTDLPATFERSDTRTELVLPLAIEFRPAAYFHVFSGFGMRFYWDRTVKDDAIMVGYLTGHEYLAGGSNEENNYTTSTYFATLGFSLRYAEKLFVDVHTGSDITPDYLQNYYVNLRYVF